MNSPASQPRSTAHGTLIPTGTAAGPEWVAHVSGTDGAQAPDSALPGAWILPGGLVDAHVHHTMNFGRVMPHTDGSSELVAANGRAQVRAGVLAVRDAGCAWGGTTEETVEGPRVQRAGSLLAPPHAGYPNVCRHVHSDDLVRAALDDVAAGAHWVKIFGDFPGADGNWFAAPPCFPRQTIATLVHEVHAAGARVMAHSTGLGTPDLIAAGVDCIEHAMVLTDDLIAEMAQRRIAWSTTLTTALKHVGPLAALDNPTGAYIRSHLDRIRRQLPYARALGVTILAGTDEIGVGRLVDELVCLTEFGLTPADALAIGSVEARAYLGIDRSPADAVQDFVTYHDDPRHSLDALRRPAVVVRRGQRVL